MPTFLNNSYRNLKLKKYFYLFGSFLKDSVNNVGSYLNIKIVYLFRHIICGFKIFNILYDIRYRKFPKDRLNVYSLISFSFKMNSRLHL